MKRTEKILENIQKMIKLIVTVPGIPKEFLKIQNCKND